MNFKEEANQAFEVLKRGGTILYPTDTVWGIGCDATNFKAVEKVYQIKKRTETKALICLVSDIKMLEKYIENIPDAAYDILKYVDKPTTIIYDNPIGIAQNLIAPDNSLGIRICKDDFCQQLLQKLRRSLVSTSANISGQKTPESFAQIPSEILKAVDYVVNLQPVKNNPSPSTIIKLSQDGKVKVIRK